MYFEIESINVPERIDRVTAINILLKAVEYLGTSCNYLCLAVSEVPDVEQDDVEDVRTIISSAINQRKTLGSYLLNDKGRTVSLDARQALRARVVLANKIIDQLEAIS